jgi:hypothetical protein
VGSIPITRFGRSEDDVQTAEEKRAYQRAHYHANKEMWRRKRMKWEAKIRALIVEAKGHPCADCGGRWHPLVMEFDHLPGMDKRLNLGDAKARKLGLNTIREEIAKCEVLCPTCHRIRTLRRQGKLA